jgi:hypothetical protein
LHARIKEEFKMVVSMAGEQETPVKLYILQARMRFSQVEGR